MNEMTDQPQPGRQDGDGLLPCPLCGSTSIAAGLCFVEASIKHEPAVRCSDCGCRATLKAWNTRTQPTRGGAEGAEEPTSAFAVMADRFGMKRAAPPKPAPDAMRLLPLDAETRRDLNVIFRSAVNQRLTGSGTWDDVIGDAINAIFKLAAPVPPADGAREELLKYLDIFLHPNPTIDLSGLVCKHGLAIEACMSRECENPMAYETVIKRARDYIAALSPSGTGAAEPDAWAHLREAVEDRRYSNEAIGIYIRNAWAALSLPVQPGAGEREARAEDIAIALCLVDGRNPDDEAPRTEMCDGDNMPVPWWMVYVEYAEALLAKFNVTSRQAPPSSSEGGR